MDLTVVPHVHWDREWHFTREQSRVLLDRYLADVLDLLDADPRIPSFLFDAQTSLADDFLADHPEREAQLRRLVAEGRLAMGPWYTQCDQMGVHGELVLRNLLWGIARARELGRPMLVGYAPDCFGQAAQMPQIYAGLGIGATVFKRGLDLEASPTDEFVWDADDGSSVFALRIPSYMNFRAPSGDSEKDAAATVAEGLRLAPRRASNAAILFNGFDQHPARRDIADIVEGLQEALPDSVAVAMGSLEDAAAAMAKAPGLPHLSGEMTSARGNRVHKTIHSSRADLKRAYAQAENLLIRQDEPLQAIYWQLTGREERGVLRRAWSELMEVSAHDAVGSCNSDEVNASLGARLAAVRSSLAAYRETVMRAVANGCGAGPESVQVWNLLPFDRREEVRLTVVSPWPAPALSKDGADVPCIVERSEDVTEKLAEQEFWNRFASNDPAGLPGPPDSRWYRCRLRATVDAPALGYATFSLVDGGTPETAGALALDNGLLRVEPAPDGTARVTDLLRGRSVDGVFALADDVDAGDSYDWSSDPNAPLVCSELAGVRWAREGDRLVMSATLPVPADREARANGLLDSSVGVRLELRLPSDKPVIEAELHCANHAVDHRLRVVAPCGFVVTSTHADQLFGAIERPADAPHQTDWREAGYDERPVAVEPMQSVAWAQGAEAQGAVAVMSDSVKEYEAVSTDGTKDALALTVFRSYTMMGRADLPDRPGRESGKPWPSPDSALLAEHTGEVVSTFAVAFAKDEQEVLDLAARWCCPFMGCQERGAELAGAFVMDRCVPAVPRSFSAASLCGPAQPSIYKLSEDGRSTVLRACALAGQTVTVTAPGTVVPASLDEAPLETAPEPVRNKILTYRIERSDL